MTNAERRELGDTVRGRLRVHGEVGNFLEFDTVPKVSKAMSRTEELQFGADLMTWTHHEEMRSIISVILPSSHEHVSLMGSV